MLFVFFLSIEWDSMPSLPDTLDRVKDAVFVGNVIIAGVEKKVANTHYSGIIYLDTLEGVWHNPDTSYSFDKENMITRLYYDEQSHRVFALVVYVFSDPRTNTYVYYSDDTGKVWHSVLISSGSLTRIFDIKRLSDGKLYLVGGRVFSLSDRYGAIYYSDDNGLSWDLWKKTNTGESGELAFILEKEEGVIWTADRGGYNSFLYEDTLGRTGDLIKRSRLGNIPGLPGFYNMIKTDSGYLASGVKGNRESRLWYYDEEKDEWNEIFEADGYNLRWAQLYTTDKLLIWAKYYNDAFVYYSEDCGFTYTIDSSFQAHKEIRMIKALNDERVLLTASNPPGIYISKKLQDLIEKEKIESGDVLRSKFINSYGRIEVCDVNGRIVYKGEDKTIKLGVGVYFVKYKNNNKEVVKKLVIVR